jgi:hypothetical protein
MCYSKFWWLSPSPCVQPGWAEAHYCCRYDACFVISRGHQTLSTCGYLFWIGLFMDRLQPGLIDWCDRVVDMSRFSRVEIVIDRVGSCLKFGPMGT